MRQDVHFAAHGIVSTKSPSRSAIFLRPAAGEDGLFQAVWAGMLALLLWSYLPNASRIPLAEDWYTVPLVTGHPVNLASWLWEQNNEHRMPIARLLLLGPLKASGGDYRAGGLLNMALLAAGAAGLLLFVRHLRGGRTDVGDAFVPLTLLHFGHSVDVLFPFQITFVLSLGLIMLAGCPLFLPTSVTSRPAAAVAGGALLLLPLSGFLGLLFVPGSRRIPVLRRLVVLVGHSDLAPRRTSGGRRESLRRSCFCLFAGIRIDGWPHLVASNAALTALRPTELPRTLCGVPAAVCIETHEEPETRSRAA